MKTSNAVEILNHKFNDSVDIREQINEELIDLQISQLIYQARTAAGLTQKELAEKIGTQQSVVARLENADYRRHSVKMLQRIASALGKSIQITFAEVETEVVAETSTVNTANHLGQLLHRKFELWLESGWQTVQSLGLALQLPQFQPVTVRGNHTPEPDLLEAEIMVAENLANTEPNNPLASIRMAKTLDNLGYPMSLVISVSQISDCEPVNVFLQLYALNGEILPADVSIRLLDKDGQPEYYSDASDEVMEDISDGQTPIIYLMFKCPKGESFGLEINRGENKIREQFFV